MEIKKAHSNPRRSQICRSADVKVKEVSEEVSTAQSYILALTAAGTIKKVSTKNYNMSNKNLIDGSMLYDVHTSVLNCVSTDVVLVFSERGNVLKTTIDKIKECKWRDKGYSLNNLEQSAHPNEKAIAVLISGKGEEVLFFTKEGMVKRTTLADTLVTKPFYQAVKINDGDRLIGVEYADKNKNILMLSEKGMSLSFDYSEVPLQGRISAGVKGINLDEGDKVVFAGLIQNSDVIIATTEAGYLKKIECSEFALGSRYRKGLKYFNLKSNDFVCFACLNSKSNVIAVDFGLKLLPLDTKKFKPQGRLTSGDEIIKKKFLGVYPYC